MARLVVDPAFVVGTLDRRLFGSFVEHMGRCVYTGIYEPATRRPTRTGSAATCWSWSASSASPSSATPAATSSPATTGRTASGRRSSGRAGSTWPGARSRRTSSAPTSSSPGPRKAGRRADLAVNLGTRGIEEAVELLEYCNLPAGTELPDRRVANGTQEPHGIRLWCLGNEMDGPWQIGHKTAEEYGRLAEETANAMRRVDPGHRAGRLRQFEQRRDADLRRVGARRPRAHLRPGRPHLRCTPTTSRSDGDQASFLAASADMDRFITIVVATADHVQALKRSDEADRPRRSTSGTSGTSSASPASTSLDIRGGRPADRGHLHRRRTRWSSAAC